MHRWTFAICFALIATLHLSKINADESEVASENNVTENEGSSTYVSNEPVQYTDSYANYYATQWTPELYQKYDSNIKKYQDYYAAQHAQRQPLRKQDLSQTMIDMLGTDAAITLGTLGAVMGTLAAIGVTLNTVKTNSICTTAKALGDTSLTTTSTSNMAALDPATATSPTDAEFTAYNALIIARFNLIENAINGYATPSCWT